MCAVSVELAVSSRWRGEGGGRRRGRRRIDWLTWLSTAWGAQRETLDRNAYDDDGGGDGGGGDDDDNVDDGGGGDDDNVDGGGGGSDGHCGDERETDENNFMLDLAMIYFSFAMVAALKDEDDEKDGRWKWKEKKRWYNTVDSLTQLR